MPNNTIQSHDFTTCPLSLRNMLTEKCHPPLGDDVVLQEEEYHEGVAQERQSKQQKCLLHGLVLVELPSDALQLPGEDDPSND